MVARVCTAALTAIAAVVAGAIVVVNTTIVAGTVVVWTCTIVVCASAVVARTSAVVVVVRTIVVGAHTIVVVIAAVAAVVAMETAIVAVTVAVVAGACTRMAMTARGTVTAMTCHATMVGGGTMAYEGRGSVVGAVMPETAMPTVPACGMAVEEVGAMIVLPEGEVPIVVTTPDGAIEIVCSTIEAVLPVEEDVTEICVTIIPIIVERIGSAYVHQILEVNLIDLIVLLGGEVELIGHLVGEIVRVLLRLAEAHAERGENTR